jgi:hypothetical protein
MLQRISSSNIKQECTKHGQPRPSMVPSAMPRRQRPTIASTTSQARTSIIAFSAVADPSVPFELTEAEQRTCQPASTSYTQTLPERKQLRDNQGRLMLKNLTLKEMEQWCISIGESTTMPDSQPKLDASAPASACHALQLHHCATASLSRISNESILCLLLMQASASSALCRSGDGCTLMTTGWPA